MRWGIIGVVVAAQGFFLLGDYIARLNLRDTGFSWSALLSWWFVLYMCVRQVATILQLWVFANAELARVAGIFTIASIVMANVVGVLFLTETLSFRAYTGVLLAVVAGVLLLLED